MIRFALYGFLAMCILSSTSVKAELQAPVTRANEDNLTRAFAEMRRAQVKSVRYDLHFTFDKGEDNFKSQANIAVELNRTDWPLTIDLKADRIKSVKINEHEIKDYVTRNGSIDIPPAHLKAKNQIEIITVSAYSKEGEGFQRSIDPEDKSEYVFSDFEPNYAHTFFPCFDQPDIKATYRLTVDAPQDWIVVANALPETSVIRSGIRTTTFHTSAKFSTYLVFLAAGPFVEFKDREGLTPLYIHVRKSLAKYVDANRIFEVTRKGLRFYSAYFHRPYPFPKYGQIFIPEFSWGGMENPGAVALNEKDLFRGPVSQSTIESRDDLILHEMAHMWFGDLVTMKWWNDLWLNESFATYMASLAQDRAMHAKGVWLDFFSDKTWGYWQDQLVTTHPIETEVPDTRSAKGNFDGITYAKGAASLKQLHFLVGENGFRDGVRSYFEKYADRNTTRADFISEIQSASHHDLSQWTSRWLQTAGPNRVEPKWSCALGKIAKFDVLQTASSSNTLSPHRTQISLFRMNTKGTMIPFKTADVIYETAATPVKAFIGERCPDFVFSNSNDQDYALFSLDPLSLKAAKAALLGGVTDPLTRVMIWNELGQMVRDLKLKISDYFEIALPALAAETDDSVLAIVAGRHSTLSSYYQAYLTAEQRRALAPGFEAIVAKRLNESEPKSNAQMTFFDFYTDMAQTPAGLERLANILNGTENLDGLEIDQDRRWKIISALADEGAPGSRALIEAEMKRDKTTSGERYAFAAQAALPEASNKSKYWKSFQSSDKIPFSNLRGAAGAFNNANSSELSKPFVAPFFDRVTSIDWSANDNLIEIYFERLFPQVICSDELLQESRKRLAGAKNLTDLARRGWLEANDELEHCVAIRK